MRNVKVLVVGSTAVRRSIKRKLELVTEDARVVAEAPNSRAAVMLTRRYAPHLVFLADDLADEDPAVVVESIRRATPGRVEVILVPAHALDGVPEGVPVMPRSQYTQRAMLAAMTRVIARVSA